MSLQLPDLSELRIVGKSIDPNRLRNDPSAVDILLESEEKDISFAETASSSASSSTLASSVSIISHSHSNSDDEIDETDEATRAEQYGLNDSDHEEDGDLDVVVNEDDEEDADSNERDEKVEDDSVQGFFGHQETEKENAVFCLALSPADDTLVISGDQVDRAIIWNLESGDSLFELVGHTDSVVSVDFSADGRLAATGSMDCTVRIWAASTGKLMHVLEGPSAEIEWIRFHHRGPILLAGSADGTAWMWNADVGGACMQVFAGHQGPVLCGLFANEGKVVCTGSEDCTVCVWNPKTGKAIHRFSGDKFHEAPVTVLSTHSSQPWLVSGSADGQAFVMHLETGKIIASFRGHRDSVEAVGFCATLPYCATGSMDNYLIIWDVNTKQQRFKLKHDDGVVKLKWHPTEPLVFTACLDGVLRLWDSRSGSLVTSWKGHQDQILDFAVTRSGLKMVSGGDDQVCLVFDVKL